jgi:RNA polymerase sigma-70 factor (sigma-E family)
VTEATAAVKAGEDAFDRLLRDRSRALLRTAYLLTGDRQLAEDLLQTALTKTYLRWGRLRDVQAGEAYVRRVMVTTYSAWWRRRWNDEYPTDTPPEGAAPDAISAADDRDVLRRALAGLSKRQRAMVVMRFYGDLSENETAAAFGVSVGTVKSTVARALARLREAASPSLSSRPTVVRLDDPVAQRTPTP